MIKKGDMQNLLSLLALQLGAFIVLEAVVGLLVFIGIIPPVLTLGASSEISINTIFILVVGLVSILIAAFWLAILAELDIVKVKRIKI